MENNKIILKNQEKIYNFCFLDIDLKNIKTTKRSTKSFNVGVSTSEYGNVWFKLPEGKALFKTYNTYREDIKKYRMINELLCCVLSKQVGINCAKYTPAHIKNDKGLISYNILNKDEKLINCEQVLKKGFYTEPTLFNIAEALEYYKNAGYNVNKKQIILDLYKMIVFDALTMQTDRNTYNIHFIVDKQANLKVAPLIDNEFAFFGEFFYPDTKTYNMTKDEILRQYAVEGKYLIIEKFGTLKKFDYLDNLKDILILAKKNKSMKDIFFNIIDNINIDNAINELKKYGIKIEDNYKNYIEKIININIDTFKEVAKNITKLDIKESENIL